MLFCVAGAVFGAAMPGTAGSVIVQDGPNAEGLFFEVKIHYEAFDGTDASDPLGITGGLIQFAYILEYLSGNEPVSKFDVESTNGIALNGSGALPVGEGTVNGVTGGDVQVLSSSITEYIPGGNDVARYLFVIRGVSPFIGDGKRSSVMVYTASNQSWIGQVLGIVQDNSLSASDKVLGPSPALVPTKPRTPGYWKHQIYGKGKHKETDAQLTGYFNDIEVRSAVFAAGLAGDFASDEAYADSLLDLDKNSIMLSKAKKHLMAMWLNISSGKIDYFLPFTFDPVFNTIAATVGEAIEQTEATILNPASTDAELENVKDMMDMLNNL